MNFEVDPQVEAFRAEVRRFLDEHLPPELVEEIYRTGVSHDEGFSRALAERGWIAPGWAPDGSKVTFDPYAEQVLGDELFKAEAPMIAIGTTNMVANVIRHVGSDALKDEILPKALSGEVTIVLGMSEPEAGSDVASVTTRARRSGDEWIIDGQKMFTTNGHLADYVFLLTRTNPDVSRHRGLTTFLVPLDTPGIEAQAVYTLSGERTNITFYSDVRIDDRWRIGEVDRGWDALMISLQDEHSAAFSPHLSRLMDEVEAWATVPGPGGVAPVEDAGVQERLGRWSTAREIAELFDTRVIWMEANGLVPITEGPMAKLFSSEALVAAAEDLTELVGPDGLRSRGDPTALRGGMIEHALRFSVGTTIYAGTSEIQRNIIAQRGCDLPRA